MVNGNVGAVLVMQGWCVVSGDVGAGVVCEVQG